MRSLFFLFSFLFLCSNIEANQLFEVSGKVLNSDGYPVIRYPLELIDNYDQVVAAGTSDSLGRFVLIHQIDHTSIETQGGTSLSESYLLGSAFPNPFNPRTSVPFFAPGASPATVSLHTLLGQEVLRTDATFDTGWHRIDIHVTGLAQGMYLLRVSGAGFSLTESLTFISTGISPGSPRIQIERGPGHRMERNLPRDSGGLNSYRKGLLSGQDIPVPEASSEQQLWLVFPETAGYLEKRIPVPAGQDYHIGDCLLSYSAYPLEDYFARIDPAYRYELKQTLHGQGYTAYVLRMVSQSWLTPELVDPHEWWHWITIIVPDQVQHHTALLWIGGGSRFSRQPAQVDPQLLHAALATRSVVIDLHNIPFQPVQFGVNDPSSGRSEDDLIAFGWSRFLQNGARNEDISWLAQLPMTRAAIRAMDTVSDFLGKSAEIELRKFMVTGGSKRGWTTWLSAIFDERVVAIAPAVIDVLNLSPSFQHHWLSYGFWSPAIWDYEREGIMDWNGRPEFERLAELIDPYSYLDRLSLPKFIVNSTGDEFFLPDSWQFYWEDLPGEKHLRYVPNTGHSLASSDAAVSMIAFYEMILQGRERPAFEWEARADGFYLEFESGSRPDALYLWNADNPEGRDFRIHITGANWSSTELELPQADSMFVPIQAPESGFSGWMIEAVFENYSPLTFRVSTGVVVLPDEYPFSPDQPAFSIP